MFCNRRAFALCLLLLCSPAAAALRAQSPLIAAVKEGNLAAVRSLIGQRADINAREVDGTTALHWATQLANLAAIDLLISAGANVNAVNRYGVTSLSLAARQGNAALLTALFDAGADLRIADSAEAEGQTLLMQAARTGSVEAIRLLVAHGADVNAREQRTGTTALMRAAIEDRPAAVSAILAAGAEIDARSALTRYPHTPPAVVGDPLEEGASYVGQTVLPKGGWTALMYAVRQGLLGRCGCWQSPAPIWTSPILTEVLH
jgi:ankyrin repeat protein